MTDFKKIIQKLVIKIWNRFCLEDEKAQSSLYLIKNLEIQRDNNELKDSLVNYTTHFDFEMNEG